MKLVIEDKDFLSTLSEAEKKVLEESELPATLGTDNSDLKKQNLIMRKLPVIISNLYQEIDPLLTGFEVESFEIEVKISGSPFGVGIDGSGKVCFTKTRQ